MYALLTGCMSAYIYEKAFILTAGTKYDCDDDDVHKHITNLSVNKKLSGHPGQIPVNIKEAYPEVTRTILLLLPLPLLLHHLLLIFHSFTLPFYDLFLLLLLHNILRIRYSNILMANITSMT